MAINFKEVVIKIQARAKCSRDEAWSGLAQAFLSLDRNRTEREQYWFLIHYGSLQVRAEIARYYTPVGIYQVDNSEYLYDLAADNDEWEFLNWFDEGPVREYARQMGEGFVKLCSFDSVRNFLRKSYPKEASYEASRQIFDRVRTCAARL